MATIITYPSALEYWLSENGIPYHFHFDRLSSKIRNQDVLDSVFSRKDIAHTAEILNFSLPVHVSVPPQIKRIPAETVLFHKLPKLLPEYSFHKINEDLYIAGPELCFVHAAALLSVPQLVLLANDLCAIYIKDELEEYRQRRREPVTSINALKSYLSKVHQIPGIQNARAAIRYALDRSNSPMESRFAVPAALSFSRGGYGLILPQLNPEIRLPGKAADYLGRSTIMCDMGWKDQKVVLEYDSNLAHLDIRQHFIDKKRTTALTLAGYKVISITAEQLRDFRSIEMLFLHIRSVLNMRTHKNRWDACYELRRKVVNEILLQKTPVSRI